MRFGLERRTDYCVRVASARLVRWRTGAPLDAGGIPLGHPLALIATAPHRIHYGTAETKEGIACRIVNAFSPAATTRD
jgi:hypothetical protein